MRCEDASSKLDALADGELGRAAEWRVRRHVESCPACAREVSQIRAVGQRARNWPDVAVPTDLRDRIAAALAAAPGASGAAGRAARLVSPGAFWRLSTAGAVSLGIVVALVLLFIGQQGRRSTAFAAVQAAMRSVNTWHLHGWKMQEGRRIPWEIWGRRRPFLYREQLGDTLVLDDGNQRLQIYPAQHTVRRDDGFVLRTASQHGPKDKDWSFAEQFLSLPPSIKPRQQTASTLVFSLGTTGMEGAGTITDWVYTVDRRTMLPTQIEVRRGSGIRRPQLTAEYLRGEYSIALPASLSAPPPVTGLPVVDATGAPRDAAVPAQNVARAGGLSAQLTPVAMDMRGVVVARMRVWLGDLPLNDGGSIYYDVRAPSRFISHQNLGEMALDDVGRTYTMLEDRSTLKREYLVLAPLEPLPQGAPLPSALEINLDVAANTTTPVSGARLTEGTALVRESLAWTARVPDPSARIDIDAYRDPHVMADEAPLDSDIAAARWLHYLRKNNHRRAAEWLEASVAACDPASNIAQMRRLDLALEYERRGYANGAEALYRAVIADSRRHPEIRPDYRKRASASLSRLSQRKL